MRYIGSKANLLQSIETVISKNTTGKESVFCDIFSGTGVVARYFKPRYEIHSNDALHFSYVIQKATVENNIRPDFSMLRQQGIVDPFSYLEDTKIETFDYNDSHYFITQNYTPHDHCKRMYLSNQNAVRIDFIRNTIECWKLSNLISEMEYYYLLAALIEGVPSISNITGTYGAYLKDWDKRTFKQLELLRLDVVNNNRQNKSYNEDALKLINSIEGDIIYIDPPYNERQYAPNYHLLETISRYDSPHIKGITGMRPYDELKSSFCVKSDVQEAFETLVDKAKFSNIILSYSTDGLMSAEQIARILKKHGIPETYQQYAIPYRKYKSKATGKECALFEYLFYIKKDIPRPLYLSMNINKNKMQNKIEKPATRKYIKSPMNYIGGKYKLLPQILPLFPKDINVFIDLFSGGCNVGINAIAHKIVCNDINTKLIDIFVAFKTMPIEDILRQIDEKIQEYKLSKENQEGFIAFRNYYNITKNPIDLYTLACYSFNYQFRFNNNHEYNNPFGRNRSQFSESMRKNLIAFIDRLQTQDILFVQKDFKDISLDNLNCSDFIYCDPPYLITTGTYNDGNRGFKDWGDTEERQLYAFLDIANEKGIRFALSNVLEHKGKQNRILKTWAEKYNIIDLNCNYSNASYNTQSGKSSEVLITNY